MINSHHELNMKDIEISTLKMQNELKREKEIVESFNKSSEAIKHFDQFLKSPRSNNDTSGLGFTGTEEGETSKSVEQRSEKGKNSKSTSHYCNKKGHIANFCKSRNQLVEHTQKPNVLSQVRHASTFDTTLRD